MVEMSLNGGLQPLVVCRFQEAPIRGGALAMAIEAELMFAFTGERSAQEFSDWLFHNGYTNNTLFLNTVRVMVSGNRDRVVVKEEVHRRGGTIIEDNVQHY
jgi:hypothetical protein